MTALKELEARVAALESQMRELMEVTEIKDGVHFNRKFHADVEAGKIAEAPLVAAREAAEAEIQAANVVWIEASAAPNANQFHFELGAQFLEWKLSDKNEHERLYGGQINGRIQMRSGEWAARLARTPELAALVDAKQIAVREIEREEAIKLERRARAEERR